METESTIVVGLDETRGSQEALQWAIVLAAARGAVLHLVHGLPDPLDRSTAVAAREAGEALLAAAAQRAADAGVGTVRQTIGDRPAGPLLLDSADDAELLVVGSRGGGARLVHRGDSVGAHVSRFARCPVVVVSSALNHPTGRVTVSVRGAASDRRALDFAFDYAAATHCELEVLHAWREPDPGPLDFSPLADGRVELHRRASEILLSEELAGFATTHPDVRVRRVSLPADPRDAMLWSSAHADLLVVSAPDPSVPPESAQLMEVAALRHAHCPVAFAR